MKLRFSTFIICSLSVLLFTGCARSEIANTERKKTIDVIVKTDSNDFWQTVKLGAEAAGKEFGVDVNFRAASNEKDIDGQIHIVGDAINRKADAIVLAACDYKRLVNISVKAVDSGIPVIIIDSALDSSKVSSFIATDNMEAGRLAGKKLMDIAGEKCNVMVMSFVKEAASAEGREKGLIDVIGKQQGITVVDTEYSFSDDKVAEDLTKKALSKYNNINAIVALNAPSVVGVAKAIQEMKLNGKVKVIGFDSTPEEVVFMEDDVIQATVVQNPYSMGYLGVKNALDVLNKKSVDKYIDTGSTVIDKNNMYTPENQKLLFPFVY